MTKTKKATYRKEAKNAKALTQLTAWLKAASINVRPSKTQGCDLTIQRRGGGDLEVKVGISYDDARPSVDHLFVLACELTSRHAATALRAFNVITVAAGYGAVKKPIDRGEEPTKKLHFDDNFELVAMRHKEFRKVPNPTATDYAQFDKVIKKAVSRFLYINAKICRRHLLQFEDLLTYAQIWTANYLGLYKVAEPTNNDNERKLYAHLCQRFGNFVEVLLKKERNCIASPETVSVALLGRPYEARKSRGATAEPDYDDAVALETAVVGVNPEDDGAFEPEADAFDDLALVIELTPEEEAAAEQREARLTEAKRRKVAQKTLKTALGSMDHDTLITTLAEAAENTFLCYDARAEAKKQLRLHRKDCPKCSEMHDQAQKSA